MLCIFSFIENLAPLLKDVKVHVEKAIYTEDMNSPAFLASCTVLCHTVPKLQEGCVQCCAPQP